MEKCLKTAQIKHTLHSVNCLGSAPLRAKSRSDVLHTRIIWKRAKILLAWLSHSATPILKHTHTAGHPTTHTDTHTDPQPLWALPPVLLIVMNRNIYFMRGHAEHTLKELMKTRCVYWHTVPIHTHWLTTLGKTHAHTPRLQIQRERQI